ncbi:MAG: DedA family protein [Bdellovibrionaceae bacterium]|jgi:membrane protein DedA with SNARE-associated domain|nr:DedA family protein [Pseudobdellovibrionaceae bacterium]
MSASQQLIVYLSGFSGPMAYTTILGVLLACGLGVPIPEDITLIAAGILSGLGKISVVGAYVVGYVGVLLGDTILFYIGRRLGHKAFELPLIRKFMTEDRIEKSKIRIQENSKFICFTARFLPGLRAPIYLTAGIMRVRPLIFFTLDGLAALVSVPIWVYGGWFFSKNLDQALDFAKQAQIYLVVGVVILIGIYIVFNKYKKNNKAINS